MEESTLAKLVEWRGDDENGKTVLEDVFREVIVISDGDDDREEEDDPLSDRDQSVEIISSNPVHGELQTRPINYTSRPLREPLRELSDDDEPPGFRVVPDIPRRDKIDRRGFSRYQAWDRAIKRYRQRANGLDLRSSPRICHTDYQLPLRTMEKRFFGNIVTETEPVGFCRVYTGPFTGFGAGSGRREMPGSNSAIERRVSFGEAYFFIITPNCKFSEADNPLLTPNEQYEPYPPVESFRQARHLISSAPESSIQRVPASSDEKRLLEQGGPADVPIFVSHLRESPGFNENQEGRHSGAPITYLDKRWLKPQDRALPSIEGSLSPRLQAEPLNHDRLKHMAERMSDESSIHPLTSCQLRSNIPRPLDEDEYKFLTPKRRRVAPEETIRHDPGRMSHGAARPATFNAPKDTFPDEPFTSQGHISARRSPAEGDSPIRRSHAVPAELRYLERYQPEALLAPHSTHPTTKTGSLSGQGPADHTDTQFSHNHEPGLYSYRSGSAWPYKGPGTSAVIQGPMYFRGSRAGGVHCEEQGLPIKCMNTIGQSELQVSSVPHRANDYSAGFDDSYRRRQLYAEDFVRPVDLADSDPLELASRPHHRARLAKEASASGHDMPGNSVLSLHGNLRRFDSRGAFPVYGNASVGYNQNMAYYGRDIGGPYDSSGTANQLARRHPALIRYDLGLTPII